MKFGRIVGVTLGVLLGANLQSVRAATVSAVEFLNGAASSEILLRSDAPLEFDVQKNPEDRQVTLLLKGSAFSKKAMRRMDTSSFDGPVSLVSPFNATNDDPSARLVVQLRSVVEPEIQTEGNVLRIILAKGSAGARDSTSEEKSESDQYQDLAKSSENTDKKNDQNLEQFIESQSTKRFIGRPITLQLRETPIADVLTMIGEASGFNIILGDGVDGKITLSLIDVPWDQALDVVLTSKRLGAERKNNVLRVTTLANLTTEKEEQLRAKLASERAAVRLTRIFPINFAKLSDLKNVLSAFSMGAVDAQRGAGGAAAASSGFSSSSVQVDDRTNSLIVQDTFENLEKMRKLIEILDVQTPQVLIEAKIVEASESFGKELSGSLGFSRINGQGRGIGGSFSGGTSVDGLTGTALSGRPKGGSIGYSPTIAFLPPLVDRLNLLLSMEESEEKIKVISSPKMVVLNKKEATILKSTPTTINQTVVSPGGPPIVTQAIVQANLSLKVTPTVTNASSVLLQMDLSRDAVVNNIAAPRNLKTEVIVDSGSTLVIGGIYSSDETDQKNGFPFLKDLPFVGWLFGSSTYRRDRSELLIFITPRVLNEQDSGLISQPQEGGQTVPNQG